MTTTPPEADSAPAPRAEGPDDGGPRRTREELRDLGSMRRVFTGRKIAGVAGGIARHYDIDPIIPRVALVVLALFGGVGLLVYAVCWLILPLEGSDEATIRLDPRSRTVALVGLGALTGLALLGHTLSGWFFPWPLAIAGAIILVVMTATRGRREHPGPLPTYATTPTYAPLTGAPAPAARSAMRRRGPVLFWYALAIIALGIGVLATLDTAGVDVPDSAFPALALGICAMLLLVGAFWGGPGGLIALGLVSAVATAGATIAHEVDAGQIDAKPATAAAVHDHYDLAFGDIRLDLTDVADLEHLDGRTIELGLDVAGRIRVIVPQGLDVVVHSSIDAGDRRVFGDRLGDGSDRTSMLDGGLDAPLLTLDVSTTFGDIEISREDAN